MKIQYFLYFLTFWSDYIYIMTENFYYLDGFILIFFYHVGKNNIILEL